MNYGEMTSLLKQRGIKISNETCVKFDQYLHLLVEWNEKFNLTSITSEGEVIEKHFYDCLLASDPTLMVNQNVADLGSGAGFPGLVWAIAYPTCQFTLIDATKKKCSFLEEVAKALNLDNVKVINGRIEQLPPELRESFDIVTARAVAELRILLELGTPLLKIGGTFIAMKGSQGEEELQKATHACRVLGLGEAKILHSELPNSDGKRINLYLPKIKKTEKRYPRNYADIKKKPL